ncbi:class II glutamine amidotransferase [uncultured Tateyamaria sp.]|uniref:class II glutamine amidotransferase n=1 Tax=uncultured Tateyamaria sp. TaxID=455651 RepID=UPI0026211121|nr:class II glutamine amidotransferase [uncultured Tateyamaria sp.]
MCRWSAYLGDPIFMADVISCPCHSLIEQASAASQSKTSINADGFGVAWYDQRPEPGLFRDVFPAWSDANLASLTSQVRAPLFMAHVRASTETATSRNNCHPFASGNWSFMHNGQIGDFGQFRKSADMHIADALYPERRGATDSEALFLVALSLGLADDPRGGLERATATLVDAGRARGFDPLVRMTVAMTDGKRLFAARYASDPFAPSLYYRWSDETNGWSVVSEPYDQDAKWHEVPPGSFVTFEGRTRTILPFAPRVAALAA